MIRERWNAIVRGTAHYRRAIIIALAAWLLLLFDPFDIDKATSFKAREVALSIAATFYEASRRVTVVLIDQDFIDASKGRTWPLQYSQQGALLRRIVAGQPESIFVDLLYKNAHRAAASEDRRVESGTNDATAGDNPLDLFAPVARTQVPIFVAGLPYEHDRNVGVAGWDCKETRNVLLDQSSILEAIRSNPPISYQPTHGGDPIQHIGMVAWSGCKDLYPLLLGNNAYAPTPAYALFRQHCQTLKEERKTHPALCNDEAPKPMAVTWGAFIPPAQQAFYLADVCQNAEPKPTDKVTRPYAAVRQYLLGVVDGARTHRPLNDRLACPAVNVIPARVLMSLGSDALRNALQGQFVFVGAAIPGVPDTYLSPVHGQVPGVMWHAMALDNLLTMNKGYVVASRSPHWEPFCLMVLCGFALLALIPLPAWIERNSLLTYKTFGVLFCTLCAGYACALGNLDKTLLCAGFGIAAIWLAPKKTGEVVAQTTLICFMAVLAMYVFREQPVNWITLSLACVAVTQSVRREIRSDKKKETQESTVITPLPTRPRVLVRQLRHKLMHAFSSSRTGAPS